MAETGNKLKERLKVRDHKLNVLLNLTRAINNNAPIPDLLAQYREFVSQTLERSRFALLGLQEKTFRLLLASTELELEEDEFHPELFRSIQDVQRLPRDIHQLFEPYTMVMPVFHNTKPLAYLLLADEDEDALSISPLIRHLNFLQTLTNVLVVAIENRRMANQAIEQARLHRELELAAELQSLLVANAVPDELGVDYHAIYEPHMQIGGDYYDFIELPDGRLAFCLGDVSGKGIAAAFLMAGFQAWLRAQLEHRPESLREVIHYLNRKVNEMVRGDRFITFFIGLYSPKSRELRYVNAGHLAPILMGDRQSFSALDAGCIGLGMLSELPAVEVGTVTVQPSSVLAMYSDGITEAENIAGEEFGQERLVQCMQEHFDHSLAHMGGALKNEVDLFRGAAPRTDDLTLLILRF